MAWANPHAWYLENAGFLRVFGGLSRELRSAWLSSSPIPIASLGPGTRRAILTWASTTGIAPTYANEPTVRFPNGLPDRGFLRADIVSTPGFYTRVHIPDGPTVIRWTSAHDLAIDINNIESGENKWMGDFELQESPRRDFRLLADFGGGDLLEGIRIQGPDPDPANYVRWSLASAGIKAKLAEWQKKVKREYEGG